ncbi:MAG TPA: DUF881 domain-containing protein [Mycobacteriales bacterium]|nr:DUF881 domain-containing protein [Mycobacteriales bacterium]
MDRPGRARLLWRVLVPVTALLAGLLFATSASTAQGTDLRPGRFSQLTDLISAAQDRVSAQERSAATLREQVAESTRMAAAGSSTVAAETARADALADGAGLRPVRGPGLTVTLDDAPPRQPGEPPASDNPDDLVVHQQDVQSVLNALWAGGAEAVTLMGERLISTSAVRCVGNTLLIQGRLVGPPFVVRAIGDGGRMRAALASEPGVALFRQYVDAYRLTFRVASAPVLRMPAYQGTLDLPHVEGS